MADEVHDPEVDIDPQDALELDYDEAGDIADVDAEPNDQVDDDFEHVEGAEPVDEDSADEEPDSAEDEVAEEIE